jgi:hypothetical protein
MKRQHSPGDVTHEIGHQFHELPSEEPKMYLIEEKDISPNS